MSDTPEHPPVLPAREGRLRRNRRLGLAAAVVVAALVGGGIAAVLTDPRRTPTAAAPPPSSPLAPPSAGTPDASQATGQSPPAVSPSSAAQVPGVVEVTGDAAFRSPSGNIGCQMTPTTAACDLLDHSWELPPPPADCESDFGSGAFLDGAESGLTCASDTPFDPEAPVLAYGTGWLLGEVRCTSAQDGVTCEHTGTGSGFAVSRDQYRLF